MKPNFDQKSRNVLINQIKTYLEERKYLRRRGYQSYKLLTEAYAELTKRRKQNP